MAEKQIKAKFSVGQKVFYISDGYVSSNVITGIFLRDGEILYTFSYPSWVYVVEDRDGYYKVDNCGCQWESRVFSSLKALIKSIEKDLEENE